MESGTSGTVGPWNGGYHAEMMFPIMESVRSGGDLENIGGHSRYSKDLVCPEDGY